MTPDEFLNLSKPLEIDDVSRDNIDYLKDHMIEGRLLDPLVLYDGNKSNVRSSDGRHRAIASKELGINSVPVLDFREQNN